MTNILTTPTCTHHEWERRLAIHKGAESVVRTCIRCGKNELCWSRRGLSHTPVERDEDSRRHHKI